MKHSAFRKFLFVLLGLSAVFALGAWFVPYDFTPDPGAKFKISATQLKRDRSNYWLNIHLVRSGNEGHDLMKPVRLVTRDGVKHEPADTTFGGEMGAGTTEIWFKFWLEESDLTAPISLRLNDGSLNVKKSSKVPKIADGAMRTFSNKFW